MANPLPLLIAGGALLLLASGKKRPKKKKAEPKQEGMEYNPPEELPPSHGGDTTDSSTTWVQRQEALKLLAQVKLRAQNGNLVPLCAKCDPGKVDGIVGDKTIAAVKAFQALAGLSVTGKWGTAEDSAMRSIFFAIEQGDEIPCNPDATYPAELACIALGDDEFGLQAKSLPNTSPSNPSTPPSNAPKDPIVEPKPGYGPDELLVVDAECNYILHQSERWFDEQRNRVIAYALEDMVDAQAANEINDSMLADYIPLCFTLGRLGVGPGVREFWDANVGLIFTQLQAYAAVPDVLEEDAHKYGIL